MSKKQIAKILLSLGVGVAAAVSGVVASGCGDDKPEHVHDYKYVQDGESGHHQECKDGDDTTETVSHNYGDDNVCDDCGYEKSGNVEHTHDYEYVQDGEEGHHQECKDGDDTTETVPHNYGDDNICDDCGYEKSGDEETRTAVFELIPDELEAGTYADGFNVGIFSILPDTKVRNRARLNYDVYGIEGATKDTAELLESGFNANKSVQFDGTNRGIAIYAPAPGTLSLYLDNGSSGLTEEQFQTFALTKPDGTTETLSYPAKLLRRYDIELEEAGEYKITRGGGGTTDIYYAKLVAEVPVTSVVDMKITNPGDTEFFVGQELDTSKLQVQIKYESGMVEPVSLSDSRLAIDDSAYNSEVPGTYTINVTFTDGEGNVFTDSYEVTVYLVASVELGYNKIVTGNSGYNGTYENHAVKQFYFVNESLNLDGLSVYVVLDNGTKMMVSEGYNVSTVDMSTPGKKEVVISWGNSETVVAKFNIYVAANVNVSDNTIETKVDGNLDEAQIGVEANGAYQFKTIQQSLEFLGALGLDENVTKVINLAEGTYFEKVEVNIPNVTIKGANTDATKTVIEYDALYGEKDESGFEHTTDSTATLNVRAKATGFVIENVTISNAWNSTAYFDEHKGAGYGEHRALAMLIQADKVVIDNCRLLGYQDTIEFFTGRQHVLNTYIQGRTDFIFGTNNTTYFYNCEIHSIEAGGYVTAFKGNNKDANDAVLYGAIFDNCHFTAADHVLTAANTALGRPWGAYAAVAVINSELDGHISLEASTGASSGTRYVTMSNNNPYDANVKFVEYNNTGAGAITEEVKGMRMLAADEAANYSNLSVIFGTTNGGVKYTSAWDGGKGVTITEKTYKFSDYYTSGDEYNTPHTAENEAMFGGDATINGTWAHELNQGKDQAQFMAGVVIKFNVVGEVTVTTYGDIYGLPENVVITYKDGCATLTIVATENSSIANGCYITAITIDMSKTPEDGEVEKPDPEVPEDKVFNIGDVIDLTVPKGTLYQGNKGVYNGVEVDATNGKFNGNDNSVQINAGTVLRIPVASGNGVEIEFYPNYGSMDNVTVTTEEGYIVITVNVNNTYIISITIVEVATPDPDPVDPDPDDNENTVTVKIEALENLEELVALTAGGDSTAPIELYNDGKTVITVANGIAINSNNYTFSDETKLTYRLQLKGKGSADKRSVKLELAAGATITVYVRAAGDSERQFGFYDSSYNAITLSPATNSQDGIIYTYTAASAGTYYLGGTNGYNIYSIIINYNTTGGNTENPDPVDPDPVDPDPVDPTPGEPKSWEVICASKQPSISGDDGLTVAFVDKSGNAASGNADDFKFDGKDAKLTLTLDALKAGQTITIKVYGYSGSSISGTDPKEYNPVDLTLTATNATAAANNAEGNTVTFSGAATKDAPESGSFVYTVSADGTVTLELARVLGATTRLTKLEITVA